MRMTLNRRCEQDPNQTHLGVNEPHRFVGWGRIPGAEPGPALALPQPPTPGGTGAPGQVRAHHFKTKPGTGSAGAFWGDEASSSGAVPPPAARSVSVLRSLTQPIKEQGLHRVY